VTRLRRFNTKGLAVAEQRIGQLARNLPGSVHDILYDDSLTETLDAELAPPNFHTRYELARYLVTMIDPIRHNIDSLETDSNLWSWIAIHWMNDSILNQRDTTVEIRNVARWVLDPDSWKTFRVHLVAAPFAIMDQHRDNPEITKVMLAGSPLSPGGAYERASPNQQLVRSAGVLHAMTALYVNSDGRIKRGASKQADAPGTIPRFVKYINQLEMTYDIRTIAGEDLLGMLPAEFDGFR
jgi:hypothetical protein